MNCKPGDLAYIVNCTIPENNDHFVTVVRLAEELTKQNHQPIWVVESASLVRNSLGRLVMEGTIQDCKLRPLRDPGDEAKDQMLRPLPQKVAA